MVDCNHAGSCKVVCDAGDCAVSCTNGSATTCSDGKTMVCAGTPC
jgi:hypothetical protein